MYGYVRKVHMLHIWTTFHIDLCLTKNLGQIAQKLKKYSDSHAFRIVRYCPEGVPNLNSNSVNFLSTQL